MSHDTDDYIDGPGFDEEADVLPFVGPIAESAIPVPRTLGKLWKSRIEDARNVYEMEHTLWENGYHRYRRVSEAGVLFADQSRTYADTFESAVDENLVRQNVKSTMREAYMQNPHFEYTASEDADKEFPEVVEKGINFIIQKETHPGVNLRPKARRWILHGQLTNHGVIRLDYQPKEGSLEEANALVLDIETRISEARSTKEVQELYQELERAHEELPIAAPKGMQLTNVLPHRVFVDPECSLTDLSDADWLAEEVELDRDYVKK